MKLKEVNGKVSFIMKAGKKFVKNGKVAESDKFEGYPVCVNDTYYFAATMPKTKAEPKE